MDNIIITLPKSKNTRNLIVSLLNELKISFTIEKNVEKAYNEEFVEKIVKRTKSAKVGNVVEIDPNNLWKSIGL